MKTNTIQHTISIIENQTGTLAVVWQYPEGVEAYGTRSSAARSVAHMIDVKHLEVPPAGQACGATGEKIKLLSYPEARVTYDNRKAPSATDKVPDWQVQLGFLSSPEQDYCDRITDLEVTLRVLTAIYFQANLADSEEREDWQTAKMVGVCNHLEKAIALLGVYPAFDEMIGGGHTVFSSPGKPWETPQAKLERLCIEAHAQEAKAVQALEWLDKYDNGDIQATDEEWEQRMGVVDQYRDLNETINNLARLIR